MSKLDINALRYIVMEGGGARGTTYLGAIRVLEQQLKAKEANSIDTAENQIKVVDPSKSLPAIMDFVTGEMEEDYETYIRGVAGGSAGAITTFALALGLNSDQISQVLDFEFKNFLSEKDPAKYRMIGADSSLMIGEDHKGAMGSDQKSKQFNLQLKKQKTKVRGNFIKEAKRSLIFGLIFKSIVDGAVANARNIANGIRRLVSPSNPDSFLQRVANFLEENGDRWSVIAFRFLYGPALKFLLPKAFKKSLPINITGSGITSLFLDRGLFSGFQVREFFYDLLIFAATRDTHFQRSMLKYYSNKKLRTGVVGELNASDFNFPDFKIGDRIGKKANKPIEFSGDVETVLTHLQDLTFAEFFEITNVDFCAAVSNFSANSPVYFSDKWTPQFRILEAVSASMSIPPAIRPLFNDADVYFKADSDAYKVEFPRKLGGKPLSVSVNNQAVLFVNENGQFKQTDYQLYEHVVKKLLQQSFQQNSEDPGDIDASNSQVNRTYIDLNNLIDLNTFLPRLRDLVVGDRGEESGIRRKALLTNRTVTLDNNVYVVSDDLLAFFYNAQFKGLLFDGGYLNNIPYNYFRNLDSNELEGVLAIKLDRSFPPTFKEPIHQQIQSYLQREKVILDKLERDKALVFASNEKTSIFRQLEETAGDAILEEYEALIKFVTAQFSVYFDNQEEILERTISETFNKPISDNRRDRKVKKEKKIDREIVVEFIEDWINENGSGNFVKPWAVPKSILQTAFEGYSYGSERGQIRSFSDHDHIIALYDFGVGTYDFDLSKVRPMAKMAQIEAEISVNQFFNT